MGSSRGAVLLIVGEAGVGKSALVRYLLRQTRVLGWPVHIGGCLSYGQHIPYLPWRLILEEAHRLDSAWGPEERAIRLEQVVAALPGPSSQAGYWQARFPLLAEAMGLEVPDTTLTLSLQGELRRDNTFQLLEALVRQLAAEKPAVVVLEDAYWADELSLQLAAYIGRSLADRRREGRLLLNLGMTHRLRGDHDQARAFGEQAKPIFREVEDWPGLAINLDNMGAVALAQGDLEAAQSYHQQALDLARRLRDPEGEATSLCSLGRLYVQQGHYEQAGPCLQATLEQFRRIGHRRGEADALHNLGVWELRSGQAAAATRALRQSLSIRQDIGEVDNALVTRAWLGLAALAAAEPGLARAHLSEVLTYLEREAYGGDAPQQEIWWAAFRVCQAVGEEPSARRALRRAHALIREQAGRIGDPALRQSFLERVPVNREVEEAWKMEGELEVRS